MNEHDRELLNKFSAKLDTLKDDIHNVHLEVKDLAAVASVDETQIKELKDKGDDHETRLRLIERAERKTILIASLVGAVVTGGGALLLFILG